MVRCLAFAMVLPPSPSPTQMRRRTLLFGNLMNETCDVEEKDEVGGEKKEALAR